MAKIFTREAFSKSLINCHNTIRDNDKLSPEAAFDEISKILFIKIRKERDFVRGIYTKKVYNQEKNKYNLINKTLTDYYQHLFNQVKSYYANEGLFETYERIRIRENSFEQIIEELESFNLSKSSADIKGIAFEEFLGTTFRGELGQFFTPRTVVDFMVSILDPESDEFICDPCCGSGGFLIKTYQYIREKIEKNKMFSDVEKKQLIQQVASQHLFGTDANPRMARTAKMNMIMHGDGHSGIYHHDGLLNVCDIFEERFNVILTNPPFGSHVSKSLLITEDDLLKDESLKAKYKEQFGERFEVSMQQISKNLHKPLLDLYQTGKMSGLTEVLFLERCLNLLVPGGRLGIVLPEGVMDGNKLHRVREFIESKSRILCIVSLPQEVFVKSGASIKPSILFLKKFTVDEQATYDKIVLDVGKMLEEKYTSEWSLLKKEKYEASTTEELVIIRQKERVMKQKMDAEKRKEIKRRFNYSVPVAKVNFAGIGTRGDVVDNELPSLSKEFKKYRVKAGLW